MLWVLKRTVWDGSFEYPQHVLKLMGEKIFTLLFIETCDVLSYEA